MWVESVVQVGDQPVALSVEQLDPHDRERTAAMLAWLTLDALTDASSDGTLAWQEFINSVLRDHVSFAVPDERLEDLGSDWWAEAISHALLQFLRQNELAPSITRQMGLLKTSAACRES